MAGQIGGTQEAAMARWTRRDQPHQGMCCCPQKHHVGARMDESDPFQTHTKSVRRYIYRFDRKTADHIGAIMETLPYHPNKGIFCCPQKHHVGAGWMKPAHFRPIPNRCASIYMYQIDRKIGHHIGAIIKTTKPKSNTTIVRALHIVCAVREGEMSPRTMQIFENQQSNTYRKISSTEIPDVRII